MNSKHLTTRKQAEYCLEMLRRINENIKIRTARLNDDTYEYIGAHDETSGTSIKNQITMLRHELMALSRMQ
jgi:hypothetical protein